MTADPIQAAKVSEISKRAATAEAALAETRGQIAELREGLNGFADDYQTSEHHHPDHVLIPKSTFERVAALLASSQPPGGGEKGVRAADPLTRGEARRIWKSHGGTDAPALGPDVMTIPADQFHDFVGMILTRAGALAPPSTNGGEA